jgi:hypothetical protein
MSHTDVLPTAPHERKLLSTDRDDILDQLFRCTVMLCRAQRRPQDAHDLVGEVIGHLDEAIRVLRDVDL